MTLIHLARSKFVRAYMCSFVGVSLYLDGGRVVVGDCWCTHGYCVPMPTQHAIPAGSVNEYQQGWEVNRNIM